MITIIIFTELFFIFAGISTLILGQPLTTLPRYKKPFRHFARMLKAIFKIAPGKALGRLSWALIIGFLIFSILISAVSKDNPNLFQESTAALIFGSFNILICLFALSVLIIRKCQKETGKSWVAIRTQAYKKVYGNYPSFEEHESFTGIF
jgi:hypothetical protein